ncbi:MAG: hypothetical protein DI556_08890 [Rhodovulum sulfidophilum]|uniref:XapX domain-containing protein n=1 Tax=Rhodovulum sulfidophilum TaxID=35806 RepID=A0A2W5Q626_RHOSU|nr:MAG: hypothetical protein DI556_08890 [Rhodovulum sulfidophilum]
MKLYLLSLATGVLVGAIYGLLGVRSPAPPVIALLGLLGMLAGEKLPEMGGKLIAALTSQQPPPPGGDKPL